MIENNADDATTDELIGVVDESTPVAGSGIYYVMATAVVLHPVQVQKTLDDLFEGIEGRARPFHWHKEGVEMKERMVELIIEHGVVSHCRWKTVGRKQQAAARSELLVALADDVQAEGIDRLIIEQGDHHTNRRDQQNLLDHFRDRGGVPFAYTWEGKKQRLLWIADAIAGATSALLLDTDTAWHERLRDAGVVSDFPTP